MLRSLACRVARSSTSRAQVAASLHRARSVSAFNPMLAAPHGCVTSTSSWGMAGSDLWQPGAQSQVRMASSKAKAKGRKPRDPEHPKRPASAYAHFVAASASKRSSSVPFGDWSKQLSAEWKTMDAAARTPYEELNAADRQRYDAEMLTYDPSKYDKRRTGPKGLGVKKPRNAYILFTMERRAALQAANPDSSVTAVGKLLGAEWNAMSEAEKAKWQAAAEEDKARYDREVSAAS